jgi:DNA-binding transcriptional LysR family regulator
MEMHQVRYFLAVCETLNFTRAAEQCNVSQPALTRAIKKLEEELGAPLFRRERSLTHLTELGRMILPQLEALLQARNYTNLEKAPLKLGVMCTIGPAHLVEFLKNVKSELPTIELLIHEDTGLRLVEEMVNGDFEVGLLAMPNLPDRLRATPLYRERYVIAFHQGHRFEKLNAVPHRELEHEDYLNRVNCEHPDHLAALGMTPKEELKVKYQSEREDWIQAMILAGMGCATIPEFLPLMPGIHTRVLTEPKISREVSLVTVIGRQYSPAVDALVRLAQRHDWMAAI